MIAEHLQPCDRTCLALCNRRLKEICGIPKVFADNTLQAQELIFKNLSECQGRRRFLGSLSRNLPNYVHYRGCKKLHRSELTLHPSSSSPRRPDPACHVHSIVWWPIFNSGLKKRYWLNWLHVSSVMKRHYFGPPHGLSADSLAFVEILSDVCWEDPHRLTLLQSIDALVVKGPSLCFRLQTWILGQYENCWTTIPSWYLCAHCQYDDRELGYRTIVHWRAAPGKFVGHGRPVHTCHRCLMEYQIQTVCTESDGKGLVITKWIDAGPGLNEDDWRWQSKMAYDFSRSRGKTPSNRELKRRYERESKISVHGLTRRKWSLLKDKAYVSKADHVEDNCWVLKGNWRSS